MKWNNPDILIWLTALLPLLLLYSILMRLREKRLNGLFEKPLQENLVPGWSARRRRIRLMLRLLALALALVALARPQWGFRWEEVQQRSLNIMVTLDTSKSMLAQDIKPNRLQQAKWGIRDLLKQLKGDRIGLVAFAGEAFLQCPATIDYSAFMMILDDVYAGIIPRGGTDLYKALKKTIESFDEKSTADKVIILISDGEGHSGNPLDLLPELKKQGIRVFAIGVGTLDGELIQTSDGLVKDKQGNVVKSALHERTLEKISNETGGFYIRSAPGDFGLERISKQGISQLQREEQESRMTKLWIERFQWFLGAALLALLIEASLNPRKGKRLK